MSYCPTCRCPLGTGDEDGQPCLHCRNLSRVRVRHITLHHQTTVDDLRRRVRTAEARNLRLTRACKTASAALAQVGANDAK